jgi:hypothetical protein
MTRDFYKLTFQRDLELSITRKKCVEDILKKGRRERRREETDGYKILE